GGVKPSVRLSVALSNGLCGATQGASSALPTQISVSSAATMVTGERRKLHARSWSQARRQRPAGPRTDLLAGFAGLVDAREARFGSVVGAVDRGHVLLHRPRPELVVQRHEVVLVAHHDERVLDERVALLRVHLGLHRVDDLVELRVAELDEVEAAVGA